MLRTLLTVLVATTLLSGCTPSEPSIPASTYAAEHTKMNYFNITIDNPSGGKAQLRMTGTLANNGDKALASYVVTPWVSLSGQPKGTSEGGTLPDVELGPVAAGENKKIDVKLFKATVSPYQSLYVNSMFIRKSVAYATQE